MSDASISLTARSWECHRCRKVNAPHVSQCTCSGSDASGFPFAPAVPVTPGTVDRRPWYEPFRPFEMPGVQFSSSAPPNEVYRLDDANAFGLATYEAHP